jgi:hypothetical protein
MELSEAEQVQRSKLERQFKMAFYQAGIAIRTIKEEQLYRSTHPDDFPGYCQELLGRTVRSVDQLIAATKVYETLSASSIGFSVLPTAESQTRDMAGFEPEVQEEIWQKGIEVSKGSVPTRKTIKGIVEVLKRKEIENPFYKGEVCFYRPQEGDELKGKSGYWCIVVEAERKKTWCTVKDFQGEEGVSIYSLESCNYSEADCLLMEILWEKLSKLWEPYSGTAIFKFIQELAKLQRPYLLKEEEDVLEFLKEEMGTLGMVVAEEVEEETIAS